MTVHIYYCLLGTGTHAVKDICCACLACSPPSNKRALISLGPPLSRSQAVA